MGLTVTDGELDLSMSQLEEIPTKEIIAVKNKVRKLDLSNNQLQVLPMEFAPNLTLLVELDLSKNQLSMIPDNFGLLVNLQLLDLYSNNIERLPLSFKDLKKLRWLDLKDNPLTPQLAKIAGSCVDKDECRKCARDIVLIMQEIYKNLGDVKGVAKSTKSEEPPSSVASKDKKKKKKAVKSADSNKNKKESPQPSKTPLKELEPEDKAEENLPAFQKHGASISKRHGLCYTFLRGFLWSIVLVAIFISSLILSKHPQVQPYAHTLNQKIELAKIELGNYYEVYGERLWVHLGGLKETWASSMTKLNGFVDGTLMVFLIDFKERMLDGLASMRVQVNEYLTKKD
ncbi:leucine-rich repeat-containing protein 59-like [Neocloeon triangulifer]|uniref:leucine-rich repeat-containing protein 59-like n=1 Tax=Neocloeon triangulifer TaxID=2078957 RepID=UPI00286F653B|nr:leucine-rich repeat-containing protein 59-like [Neocloeon triangulifer]